MPERVELAVPPAAQAEADVPERLPIPVAAAVILVVSVGLWTGIIWLVRLLLL
ncbi:hypothetical protein HRbin40_02030 [bacterium HR40]|nr:hypothetical protein HRbin40_02030 [bacterium HR40]